jgi:hypothetical protein
MQLRRYVRVFTLAYLLVLGVELGEIRSVSPPLSQKKGIEGLSDTFQKKSHISCLNTKNIVSLLCKERNEELSLRNEEEALVPNQKLNDKIVVR